MKLSKAWGGLSRDQKRAWSVWARNNRVLLPDGNFRRVSGQKAMSVVLANRALAGEAANPTVVPAGVAWLDGALSLRDAGPFTAGAGFVGFRAEQNIAGGTKWFVWATPPTRGVLAAPALRLEGGGIYWDWAGADPVNGWNIFQSFDGGATFQVEEAGFTGSARNYAPADPTLPTFIVGVDGNDTECTGRSGVVTEASPVAAAGIPEDPRANGRERFVTVLSLATLTNDALTASIGAAYEAVNGSWDGPDLDGAWPDPTYVWFRVHQYANGQLGPGAVMRGQIVVAL